MKPIHPQLGELGNKKLLLFSLKKVTQRKPCIKMMQLLLYQINWPPFWTWRVWGLGRVPIHPSPVSREFLVFPSSVFEILQSDLFQDN